MLTSLWKEVSIFLDSYRKDAMTQNENFES
jgi:hypothetical protein